MGQGTQGETQIANQHKKRRSTSLALQQSTQTIRLAKVRSQAIPSMNQNWENFHVLLEVI